MMRHLGIDEEDHERHLEDQGNMEEDHEGKRKDDHEGNKELPVPAMSLWESRNEDVQGNEEMLDA